MHVVEAQQDRVVGGGPAQQLEEGAGHHVDRADRPHLDAWVGLVAGAHVGRRIGAQQAGQHLDEALRIGAGEQPQLLRAGRHALGVGAGGAEQILQGAREARPGRGAGREVGRPHPRRAAPRGVLDDRVDEHRFSGRRGALDHHQAAAVAGHDRLDRLPRGAERGVLPNQRAARQRPQGEGRGRRATRIEVLLAEARAGQRIEPAGLTGEALDRASHLGRAGGSVLGRARQDARQQVGQRAVVGRPTLGRKERGLEAGPAQQQGDARLFGEGQGAAQQLPQQQAHAVEVAPGPDAPRGRVGHLGRHITQ